MQVQLSKATVASEANGSRPKLNLVSHGNGLPLAKLNLTAVVCLTGPNRKNQRHSVSPGSAQDFSASSFNFKVVKVEIFHIYLQLFRYFSHLSKSSLDWGQWMMISPHSSFDLWCPPGLRPGAASLHRFNSSTGRHFPQIQPPFSLPGQQL